MLVWLRRSPSRRILFGGLLVAALFGGAAGVRHFWPVGPGINPTNGRKIVLGMPRAEVEKLLGGPPEYSGPLQLDEAVYSEIYSDWHKPYPPGQPRHDWHHAIWVRDHSAVHVIFDDQDRVAARGYFEDTYADRTGRWLAAQRDAIWPKARMERLLQSSLELEADPKVSPQELLDLVHDRYEIQFRINPADFGVRDARELLQRQVGFQGGEKQTIRACLDEMLAKVKATYVVEDGYIQIVPAPPKNEAEQP